MAFIGYARVSTNGQELAGQEAELSSGRLRQGVQGKGFGAKTDRPELAKLMTRLEPDDVLVVTRLDRLARSPGTCSTCSRRCPSRAQASRASRIAGQTPRAPMDGSC